MANTKETIAAVKSVLSAPRVSTYEAAAGTTDDGDPNAIALYAWNAAISSALLTPLHICEVVVRNAVSETIERLYGARWPWSRGFARSLATPAQPWLYDPRRDLDKNSKRFQTTGKVIPELKFVFWQQMLDSRHEARLWDRWLRLTFPNTDPAKPISVLRQELHDSLEQVRILRNRIAHHEPIFTRDLHSDFDTIIGLVRARSITTASWLMSNQLVQATLSSSRPFLGGQLWTPSQDEIAFQAYRLWQKAGHPQGQDERYWQRALALLEAKRWWDF